MTLPLSKEAQKRQVADTPLTFRDDLLRVFKHELALHHQIRFPSLRYADDPVGFFRDILGIVPWAKQIEALEAVRDHDRVAIASGRRTGKSLTVAGLALWWYCTHKDARVILTSTTNRQVNQILWRELQMLRARSGRCVHCKAVDPEGFRIPAPCPHSALIDGDMGMLAQTGFKSDDFREIVGFTASQAEAIQGIAGSKLFFMIDEASGVPQMIYDAIEGNRAGGGKVLLTGNPTRNLGEFYDAFHSKRKNPKGQAPKATGYWSMQISSEDTPNVTASSVLFPGLATEEFIRERKLEWGENSALYQIHVKGEFATSEEGRIFSVDLLHQSHERWHEAPEDGRLWVGLDPAGPSGSGDDTVFALRRGKKIIAIETRIGLDDEGHLSELVTLLARYARRDEVPYVVLDREGPVGAKVHNLFRATSDRSPNLFQVFGYRASDKAHRESQIYDRARDELAANLDRWIQDGGALPEDPKLTEELHVLEWRTLVTGKIKVTPKDDVRKILKRSPDRYDAVALACWEPMRSKHEAIESLAPVSVKRHFEDDYEPVSKGMDPYANW